MKKIAISLLLLLCCGILPSMAKVELEFRYKANYYEYYTADIFNAAGWTKDWVSEDDALFDFSDSKSTTVTMKVRGDFFERYGQAPYQTNEFKFYTISLGLYAQNNTETQLRPTLRFSNYKITCDGEVLHETSDCPVWWGGTSESDFVDPRVTSYRFGWPFYGYPRADFKNDKYYEITFTMEHEVVEGLKFQLFNRIPEDQNVIETLPTWDEGYAVKIVKDNGEAVYSKALPEMGASKYCNELMSGTVTFTDMAGTTSLTQDTQVLNSQDADAIARQPHGYPMVRLYDINDDKWISTAKVVGDDSENYLHYFVQGQREGRFYMNPVDSTVVHNDFTSENWCEMDLKDGKFSFTSGPIDHTHTYVFVAASYSAGYAACIWNFNSGKIRDIHGMADLQGYTPPVLGNYDNGHNLSYEVNINMTLNPETTGADEIVVDGGEDVPAVYYDLSGRSSSKPFDGMNIVKRGNKVTKQVFNL